MEVSIDGERTLFHFLYQKLKEILIRQSNIVQVECRRPTRGPDERVKKVLQGWVKNTIALLRRSIINIFLKFNTVASLKMPELRNHIWLPE